jgi:CRP-like cAMP-binding protein
MIPPETIKKYHLFDDASEWDLAAVARLARRRHCEPKELVYREGEEADAIYLIELGSIELVRTDDGLTELVTLGSGNEFGEIEFFDDDKRVATARAEEASSLISLPYQALSRLLNERPDLARLFFRNGCVVLSHRIRRAFEELTFERGFRARHLREEEQVRMVSGL